jgi:hypothetical protein
MAKVDGFVIPLKDGQHRVSDDIAQFLRILGDELVKYFELLQDDRESQFNYAELTQKIDNFNPSASS